MKARSYYSFFDPSVNAYDRCSIASDTAPLIVNCAGQFCSAFPFTTDNPNGRFDYYLMYIRSGSLSISFPDGERAAGAGCTIIFSPGYHYRYSFSGDGELVYLWCHFTGSDVRALLEELGLFVNENIYSVGHEGLILSEFEKIFSAFSEEEGIRSRALGHALGGLLIGISRILSREKTERKPLERAIGYINEHYTKRISVPSLAKMENLSNSRFSVLFCEAVGMPPIRYITKLRMQHACELLLSTDLSIKQVGVTVGYGDPHFFSKHFKAYMGLAPADYREKAEKGRI